MGELTKEKYMFLRQKGASHEEVMNHFNTTDDGISTPAPTSPELKSIYPKIGVETGGTRPVDVAVSTMQGMGKDILQPGFSFANQFLMNAPRSLAKKAGWEYPSEKDVTSPVGKIASYGGGIAGGIKNPLIKGAVVAPTIGKQMIRGGVAGATYSPEDFTDVRSRALGGAIGAVSPVGERVVGKAISNIPVGMKLASARVVNSLIKPLLKDFSYGKNPGLGVAQEGLIAGSYDELAQKIRQRRQEIGKEIGNLIKSSKNSSKTIDLSDALSPIDEAIATANKNPRTNASIINRLNDVRMDLLGIRQDATGKIISQRDISKLTPLEVASFKTDLGDMTKWTGQMSDDQSVNKVLKRIYGRTKEKLNTAVPGVAPLSERYANLTSAEIATKYRDKLVSRQNLVALAPKLLSGGGILYGLGSGSPQVILASIAAVGVDKIVSSPRFKTSLATGLSKLSQSKAAQILGKYPQLRKAIVGGIKQF